MAGEEFLKFNNGQKFSFSNFKEIKEEDLKNADAETKRLFNIFAGDDNILQASEAQSLWNKIQTAAVKNKKGDSSVFDNDEMQRFLKKDKDIKAAKTKFGLDALTNMISQVFAVSETKPALAQQSLTDDDLVQYTSEEIENISVQTLSDDISNARQLFDTQNNEQGSVSKFVNATKETFDTEFASSRVGRYIRKEELCLNLLERSKSEEGLSQKEYLEAKIDLVISLIQDLEQYSLRTEITNDAINISLKTLTFGVYGDKKTKNSQEIEVKKAELEHLKSILARLKPEEINSIISQLLFVDENETPSAYNISFSGKVNVPKPQTITRVEEDKHDKGVFSTLEYEVQTGEGSLASLSQTEAYKKMSFEEVFQKERGIEYNSEAVMDYTKKESYMQFLLGIHNRREQLADMLKEARFIKTTRDLGSEQMPGEIQNNARILMSNLNTALKTIYGNDTAKIQEFIDSIYSNVDNTRFASINQKPEVITNEQGEFVGLSFVNKGEKGSISLPNLNMKLDDLTIDSMINIADKIQSNINTTYDKALNGKTIEKYGEEVKQAYAKAYGNRDSQAIANAYAQSQQEGVGYVKAGVSTIGMGVMIAGQLVPVGGQVAAAMSFGGLTTATLGSSAVTATELLTKEDKVTKEEWQELAKEVATSLALTATGMKIGKISEGVYLAVAKHCPKLIALAAEIGSDATMSLVADLAITGQIDLSGEGIAQLQGVLVGILHAKGNFKNYLDTHAGDVRVKTEANNVDVVAAPKGKVETFDEAKTTSPAENAKEKVLSEVAKDMTDEGMRLNTPERLDAELDYAERNPNAPVENLETLTLAINGQLGKTLSEMYGKLGKSFEDVITKHSHEISQLEQTYGKDKRQFAQKFTEFLADKLGVKEIAPKIFIKDMSDCDGFFNWASGELVINKNLTNSKDIETMIAHEFVHVLQFKDIVAAKGQDGVREIYLNEKGGRFIEAKTKEILEANGIDYDSLTPKEKADYKDAVADMLADQTITDNAGLVQFAQNNPIEKGSLKSYLAKLYQDEHTNMDEFDTPEYYSQIIENEAYYLGNGRIGDRIANNIKLADINTGSTNRDHSGNFPKGIVENNDNNTSPKNSNHSTSNSQNNNLENYIHEINSLINFEQISTYRKKVNQLGLSRKNSKIIFKELSIHETILKLKECYTDEKYYKQILDDCTIDGKLDINKMKSAINFSKYFNEIKEINSVEKLRIIQKEFDRRQISRQQKGELIQLVKERMLELETTEELINLGYSKKEASDFINSCRSEDRIIQTAMLKNKIILVYYENAINKIDSPEQLWSLREQVQSSSISSEIKLITYRLISDRLEELGFSLYYKPFDLINRVREQMYPYFMDTRLSNISLSLNFETNEVYEILKHYNKDLATISPNLSALGKNNLRGRSIVTLPTEMFLDAKATGLKCIIDLRAEASDNIKLTGVEHTKNSNGKEFIDGIEYFKFPVDNSNENYDMEIIKNLDSFFEKYEEGHFYIGCANGSHRTDFAVALGYVLDTKLTEAPSLLFLQNNNVASSIKRIYNKIIKMSDTEKLANGLTQDAIDKLPKTQEELEMRISNLH